MLLFSLEESAKLKGYENKLVKVCALGVDYSLLISIRAMQSLSR